MSTTYDFAALATVTDHRDADLLDLIAQFTQLKDAAWALIRQAERSKADGRAYKRLWREVLASNGERTRLEWAICRTKARTPLGAIAKGQVFLDLHADNSGLWMALPKVAIAELTAMLEEAVA